MGTPIDNENAFRAWLRKRQNHMGKLVADTIARCRRIDRDVGNINDAYNADRCAKMLKQLEYTIEDAHNRKHSPAGLTFRGDKNSARYYDKTLREGLKSLYNALKLYCEFRNESEFRK